MARKRPGATQDDAAPIRGRPPLPPRTEFGRWLRERGLTVKGAAEQMIAIAKRLGLPRRAAPKAKTLLDSVNGRHRPPLETVWLVRELTGGAIDVQGWLPRRRAR